MQEERKVAIEKCKVNGSWDGGIEGDRVDEGDRVAWMGVRVATVVADRIQSFQLQQFAQWINKTRNVWHDVFLP